jgi:hypothetical protein
MFQKMNKSLVMLVLLSANYLMAQQNSLPLNSFFKDKFVEFSGKRSIETFFPANENQLNLNHLIRDTSVQYTDAGIWLFKKHFVSVTKPEGNISISPLVDFTFGKELTDSSRSTIYRNTRGVLVEGELLNKIGFNFIFAENQSKFMQYESDYFNSRGEIRISGNSYYVENAVIPGGARTKPFKIGAYDYAYSVGSVSYQMNKNMRFDFGNNQHFIGSGYRSILLSDNTYGTPSLRFNWKINPKWTYQVLVRRNQNLYRKPLTKAVEASYESKFFGATYLTYRPKENVSISFFTAGNQLRGDSIVKRGFEWQMLTPIPLFQNDVLFGNSAKFNGISGLNIDFALKNVRLYGQLAIDKNNKKYLFAGQLGVHFFKILKVKNLNAQIETNFVPENFYAANNPKLSYSNYNLPTAHPKGNNFNEIVVRLNYEHKRLFINSKTVNYVSKLSNDSIPVLSNSIFEMNNNIGSTTTSTLVQEFELGYRFNRRYNGMIIVGWKGRYSEFSDKKIEQQMFFVGLRTGLFNQYLDF